MNQNNEDRPDRTNRFTSARTPSTGLRKILKHGDLPFAGLISLSALTILGLVIGIGVMLWIASDETRVAYGVEFIFSQDWNPNGDQYGALPFIVGTLATSLLALVIAAALGVATAVFLAELCPHRLRAPLNFMVELLAAIPSVIFGLWGIFVFIPSVVLPVGDFLMATFGDPEKGIFLPIFEGPFFGTSVFAAGLVLSVMIVPTIAAISRDVFKAVPNAQREGAYSLGCTQWETISKVVLPYGLSGVLGAVILGLGRALGETMAVTMVIGNVPQLSASLLSPGYSMASVIANEWGEGRTESYSSALLEIGLVLFVMSLLLNLFARLLVWGVARRNPEQSA